MQRRGAQGDRQAIEHILPDRAHRHGRATLQQQRGDVCVALDGGKVHRRHPQPSATVDKAARATRVVHLGGAQCHGAAVAFHPRGRVEEHCKDLDVAVVGRQVQAVVAARLVLEKRVGTLLQEVAHDWRVPVQTVSSMRRCTTLAYPCLQATMSGVLCPASLRLRQRWTVVVLRSTFALGCECCSLWLLL